MNNKYLSMIQGQQSGLNISDLIMQGIAKEFVNSIFDDDTAEEQAQQRIDIQVEKGLETRESKNITNSNNANARYLNAVDTYQARYKADIQNIADGILKNVVDYKDKDGNIDYTKQINDLNLKLDNYSNNFAKMFGDGKGEGFGTYTYRGLDEEGKEQIFQGQDMFGGKIAKDIHDQINNHIQATKIKAASKNNLSNTYQDVNNAILKLSDKELDYKGLGNQGSVLDIIDKMEKSLAESTVAGVDVPSGLERNFARIQEHRAALERAKEFDIKDELGLQLAPNLGTLPFLLEDAEIDKLDAQGKKDYEAIKGRLMVDGKGVSIKDVANEIDILLRNGGVAQVRQANFLMDRLLPGEDLSTKTATLKRAEAELIRKQKLGVINENLNSQFTSVNANSAFIAGYLNQEAQITDEGVIFSKKERVDEAEKTRGLSIEESSNPAVVQGVNLLKNILQPLRRRATTSIDYNVSDEEMILLNRATPEMAKMIMFGLTDDQDINQVFLTDGKVKYGFNYQGKADGVIDINKLQGKDLEVFTRFMMEDVELAGSKGLASTVNNKAFWSSLYFGKDNKTSGFTVKDNASLAGVEGKIFRGFNEIMALKYGNMKGVVNLDKQLTNLDNQIKELDNDANNTNIQENKTVQQSDKNSKVGKKDETKKEEEIKNPLKDPKRVVRTDAVLQEEDDLIETGVELRNITNKIEDLRKGNPELVNILSSLDKLEDISIKQLRENGYHDKGLKESLGHNVSLGINEIKAGFNAEMDIARQVYSDAKGMGLTGWFANIGDSADAGMKIIRDLEKNGEKSKYNNAKLNTLLSRYQQIKKDNNNLVQPLVDYVNYRGFMKNRDAESFRPTMIGGSNMLGTAQDLIAGDVRTGNALGEGMQYYMTGGQRLRDDKKLLKEQIDLLKKDPKNNVDEIRNIFTKLNQERAAKREQFDYQASSLDMIEKDALSVLDEIMNETTLATNP